MPVRNASAVWEGSLLDGHGRMRLGSGAMDAAYSFATRFAEEPGSNPDELVGAALAGCFSMALSLELEKAGYKMERVETRARVHVDKVDDGFRITCIELLAEVQIPSISHETLLRVAEVAKSGCPVSQALKGTEITLDARLA